MEPPARPMLMLPTVNLLLATAAATRAETGGERETVTVIRHPTAPPAPPPPIACFGGDEPCLPAWKPTWHMKNSTVLYACNVSGTSSFESSPASSVSLSFFVCLSVSLSLCLSVSVCSECR